MSATPNVQRIIDDLRRRFPSLKFQTYNRRHIGSNPFKPWSQHAGSEPSRGWYGNAVDIFDPADSYDSALLDRVFAFLVSQSERYHIQHILWRVANHHDHIHADTWPQMKDNWWYRPPPAGKLITIDEDGETYNTFDTNQEEELVIGPGDTGNTVSKIQKAINGVVDVFGGDKLAVDGQYGPATEAAVKGFQSSADIPDTGTVDGITMALLMEFVPDWVDNHTDVSGVIIDGSSVIVEGTIKATEEN